MRGCGHVWEKPVTEQGHIVLPATGASHAGASLLLQTSGLQSLEDRNNFLGTPGLA